MTEMPSQCLYCVRRNDPGANGAQTCAAYPAGIPARIWVNAADHRNVQPGDHGLTWEPLDPRVEYPAWALRSNPLASEVRARTLALAGLTRSLAPVAHAIRSSAPAPVHEVDIDEPSDLLDDHAEALLAAIDEHITRHGMHERAVEFDPDLHPRGAGGKFRSTFDRVMGELSDWARGDRSGMPLQGFSREQLRDVAKKRGLTLRRGASVEEIRQQLLDHISHEVGKATQGRPTAPGHRRFTIGHNGRSVDVGLFADPRTGHLELREETQPGEHGPLVRTFPSMAAVESWARQEGHTDLADYARQEQGATVSAPNADRVARIEAAKRIAELAHDVDAAMSLSEPERSHVIGEHITGAEQAGELTSAQADKLRTTLAAEGGASKVKAAVGRLAKAQGVTLIGGRDKTTTFDPDLHTPLLHNTSADSIPEGTWVRVTHQGWALDGEPVEKAKVEPLVRARKAPARKATPAKAAKKAVAEAPAKSFNASDAASEILALKDNPDAVRDALAGRNLAQLRAMIRVLRLPEPGSRVKTSGDDTYPWILPLAGNRADAASLRAVLLRHVADTHDLPIGEAANRLRAHADALDAPAAPSPSRGAKAAKKAAKAALLPSSSAAKIANAAKNRARIESTPAADLANEDLPDAMLFAHGNPTRTAEVAAVIADRKAAAGGGRIGANPDRAAEFGGAHADADAATQALFAAGGVKHLPELTDQQVTLIAQWALLPSVAEAANKDLRRRGLPTQTWERGAAPSLTPEDRAKGRDLIGTDGGLGLAKDITPIPGGQSRGAGMEPDQFVHRGPRGDEWLAEIAHRQGFDGPPSVASADRLDAAISSGGVQVWRGASPVDGVNTSIGGDVYYGHGFTANGIHASTSRAEAMRHAGDSGSVERMVLRPGAKVTTVDAMHQRLRELVPVDARHNDDPRWQVYSDPGRLAAALGFDAIHNPRDGRDNYIILNRTALMVEPPAPSLTPAGGSPERAARARQAEIDHARAVAEAAADLHEAVAGGASSGALRHRISVREKLAAKGGVSGLDTAALLPLIQDGAHDRRALLAEVDRQAAAAGLERHHAPGDIVTMDHAAHTPIGSSIPAGQYVIVSRPGHTVTLSTGERVRVSKSEVRPATPEEVLSGAAPSLTPVKGATPTEEDYGEGRIKQGWRYGTAREQLFGHTAKRVADRWDVSPEDFDALIQAGGPERVAYYQGRSFAEAKQHFVDGELLDWTAGSGKPIAVMALQAVARRIGFDARPSENEQGIAAFAASHPEVDRATTALGNAIYDLTQEWFAERGITHVSAERRTGAGDLEGDNLYTSWSSRGHAGHLPTRGGDQKVMYADIPVERIFSNPATGLGNPENTEIVVFGNPASPIRQSAGRGDGGAGPKAEAGAVAAAVPYPPGTDLTAVARIRDLLIGEGETTAWRLSPSARKEHDRLAKQVGKAAAARAAAEADAEIHFRMLAEREGVTVDEAKARAEESMRAAFADARIVIRRSKSLDKILTTGRMRTQFETGSTTAAVKSLATRRLREETLLGLPGDTPDAARPVYGYLEIGGARAAGLPHEDHVSSYGDVQIVLKPTVRSRTTAVVGDTGGADLLPSPIDDPKWYSFNPNGVIFHRQGPKLDRDYTDREFTRNGYIEAQVTGGVTLDDIDEVILPGPPSDKTRQLLDERGVRWRVLTRGGAGVPAPSLTPVKGAPGRARALPGSPLLVTPSPDSPSRRAHVDGQPLDVQSILPGDEVQADDGSWHQVAAVRVRDRAYISAFDADGDEIFKVNDYATVPTRKGTQPESAPAVRSSPLDDLSEDPSLDEIRSMAGDDAVRAAAGHDVTPGHDSTAEQRARTLALLGVTRAAGHDVTPGHDRLHHWWVYGPGRERWHDWTELYDQLAKIPDVGPVKAKTFASRWFHDRFGYWPGDDRNRVRHGKPPRGHRVGPG